MAVLAAQLIQNSSPVHRYQTGVTCGSPVRRTVATMAFGIVVRNSSWRSGEGIAADDAAKRDAALAGLRDFEGNLAAFLDSATGSKMHSADLAKALFSLPAVLGVEYGSGFACAAMRGSEHNDPFELDPATLSDPMGYPLGAIVSLGGCSASFVSPDGLLATNHHCVTGALTSGDPEVAQEKSRELLDAVHRLARAR